MIPLFIALAVVVALMFTYLWCVQLAMDPDSAVWRTHRRFREARQAHREVADLDREYASLTDEHRHIP